MHLNGGVVETFMVHGSGSSGLGSSPAGDILCSCARPAISVDTGEFNDGDNPAMG